MTEEIAQKITDSLKRQGVISSTPYPYRSSGYSFLKADGSQVRTRFNLYYDNEFLYRIPLEFGSYHETYSGWEFNSSIRKEDIHSIYLMYLNKYGDPTKVSILKEDLDGNYNHFDAYEWDLDSYTITFFKGFEKESSVTSFTNNRKIWYSEKAGIEYELKQEIIDKWNLDKHNNKMNEI